MPFIPHAPESLLPRSDSKNPATTCKGLTAAGKPCRRSLASKPTRGNTSSGNGVLAVLSVNALRKSQENVNDGSGVGIESIEAAAFFCWQHKEQAERLTAESATQPIVGQGGSTGSTVLLPLKERNSIDSLIERIGVVEITDSCQPAVVGNSRHRRKPSSSSRPKAKDAPNHVPRHVARQSTWEGVQGPLMSVPEEMLRVDETSRPHASGTRQHGSRPSYGNRRESKTHSRPLQLPQSKPEKTSLLLFGCCFGAPDRTDTAAVRHRTRRSNAAVRPEMTIRHSGRPLDPSEYLNATTNGTRSASSARQQQSPVQRLPHQYDALKSTDARQTASPHLSPSPSQTGQYLSLIPPSVPPQTASLLLAELSKPISAADEPGFIYIFCLKSDSPTDDDNVNKPSTGPETAAALLAPPHSTKAGQRRTSDVLREFSTTTSNARGSSPCSKKTSRTSPSRPSPGTPSTSSPNPTVLLKIGRASNVHRRMNEWTRQCGHTPSLVRFYPYVSTALLPTSSSSPSSSPSPRRTSLPTSPPLPQHHHRAASSSPTPTTAAAVGIRKVPFSRRVERLIHIELAERNVQRACGACGKRHREWFEAEASRTGVAAVDEVVRRWVGWAEGSCS